MDNSDLHFSKAPFVRLLIALICGILTGFSSLYLSNFLAISLILLLLVFLLYYRNATFKFQPIWGIWFMLFVILIGFWKTKSRIVNYDDLELKEYRAVLDNFPIEKENSFQVIICPLGYDFKILAYLTKSNELNFSKPGDIICFRGKPELLENSGNPFEFDYKKYLNNKGIGYRIFLRLDAYFVLKDKHELNLQRRALIIREHLIKLLDASGIQASNVHLISSIAFGARDEVEKETVQSFTNTGVIHVLAVSGMNVGLVFVVLNFIFGFLKARKGGKIIHLLIMLFGIWSYSLITGLCASILRAALMFTFVLIGKAIDRNANIFNSLSVSAFFLILWDPFILMDVGFQLSYAAVLSIVLLQPILYRRLKFKFWLADQIWILMSVTLAAQIGTLPFILLYFHQFPVYFWLANLLVVPLVTMILYLSFVVLFLALFSNFLATYLAIVLEWATNLVLLIVKRVEVIPFSLIKGLYPSLIQVFLMILIVVFFITFYRRHKTAYLFCSLIAGVVLLLSTLNSEYEKLKRKEIVILNIVGLRALVLTQGNEAIVVFEKCKEPERLLAYSLAPYLGRRGIDKTVYLPIIEASGKNSEDTSGDLIQWGGERILMISTNSTPNDFIENINYQKCTIVWLPDNFKNELNFKDKAPELILQKSSSKLSADLRRKQLGEKVAVTRSIQIIPKFPKETFLSGIKWRYFNENN